MSVLPIVSPANNADGIALMPVITALYPFALEEGSVNTVNCFLVKKVTSLGNNQTIPVPIKVSLKRIELESSDEYTSPDYGNQEGRGESYRSLIEITPTAQLEAHTDYSVILSKDLSKKSVFDVLPVGESSGPKPLAKGPFSGLTEDVYRVTIDIGGSESTTKYSVTKNSSLIPFENLSAKKRYIELEKGLFFKFDTGTYLTGDQFDVVCIPSVKTNEIYSWDFKTGDSLYVKPSDSNSGVIIGLPVETPTTTPVTTGEFKLVSVTPALNSVMNDPANKVVTLTFNKNIDPDSVTADSIKIIAESTTSLYYGPIEYTYEVENNKIIITFLEEEE